MVRGPFKVGKNVYADYYAFGQGECPDTVEGFPATGVVGKLQKKGPDTYEDVRGQVTADYQTLLEQLWVKDLREKYEVVLYPEALETVNNQYLGGDTSLACSAETQTEIDRKVVELVKKQHEKAFGILSDNREKLDELAQFLYEKETITGEEFMQILEK